MNTNVLFMITNTMKWESIIDMQRIYDNTVYIKKQIVNVEDKQQFEEMKSKIKPWMLLNTINYDLIMFELRDIEDIKGNIYGIFYVKDMEYEQYPNLRKMDMFSVQIDTVPDTLVNLTYLKCDESHIKYIPDTLVNLIYLSFTHTSIENIPETLVNLECLYCNRTLLKAIPNTLIKLRELDVNGCLNIDTIPDTLVNLTKLYCSYTNVKNISRSLTKLEDLHIIQTPVKKIPDTLTHLKILWIRRTNINNIPNNLVSLEKLCCSGSKMIKVSRQLKQLNRIECCYNHILMDETIEQYNNNRSCLRWED